MPPLPDPDTPQLRLLGQRYTPDSEILQELSHPTERPIPCGLDVIAVLGSISKGLKTPLPKLWGRTPQPTVSLSWTVNATTLDEAEQTVADGKEQGYQNFNVKADTDPKFDVALANLVRRLVPDGFLWADANGGYDLSTALQVAPSRPQRRTKELPP